MNDYGQGGIADTLTTIDSIENSMEQLISYLTK